MKPSVYDFLNDMDNMVETYKIEEVSVKEMKQWKKAFDKRSKGNSIKWKKYAVAVAVACMIVAGASAGTVRQIVYAGVKAFTYDLSHMLGISKDLDPYKTVVGKSVTGHGYTVTLNEVVMDDESMYISDMLTVPKTTKMDKDIVSLHLDDRIYINGRLILSGASGSMMRVDEYNVVSDMKIELPDVDTTKKMDVEIVYFVEGDKIGTISFSASGKELAMDTLTVPMNQTVTFPDGSKITLVKYTSNIMGQNIYFKKDSIAYDYDLRLEGQDDLGNSVKFFVRFSEKGSGRMEVETIDNGYVNDEAKTLTLTPYAVKMPDKSGKMSNDYKKIGEPFSIDIRR